MPIYEITVPGVPIPQPRPQVTVHIGSIKGWQAAWKGSIPLLWKSVRRMSNGRAYVPEAHAIHKWRRAIAAAVRSSIWEDQLAGPLRVDAVFLFPRTQEMNRKQPDGPRVWYAKKTKDVDNLIKAVLDAINDSEVWPDDGLVVDCRGRRYYAAAGEKPGLLLQIEPLTRGPATC